MVKPKIFFRNKLRKGMPISTAGFADGIQGIAYALGNIEVVNGHVEWTSFGAPRLFFDSGNSGVIAQSTPKAWDITLSESDGTWTATLKNCYSWRGGKTELVGTDGTLTHDFSFASDVYLAEKYNMSTGSSELVSDTTLEGAVETGQPYDDEAYMYTLLYVLGYDSETSRFYVKVDNRTHIVRALYG